MDNRILSIQKKKRYRDSYSCAYLELKSFLPHLRDQYGLIVTVGVLTRSLCDAIHLVPDDAKWIRKEISDAIGNAIATANRNKSVTRSFAHTVCNLIKQWTRR